MREGLYKVWKYPANAAMPPVFEGNKEDAVAFFRTEFPHCGINSRMSVRKLAEIVERRYVIMVGETTIFPDERTKSGKIVYIKRAEIMKSGQE